jgi:DNA polymerase-3 subunit epsilon
VVKDFYILDRGREDNEKAVIGVRNGQYVGFGYINTELTSNIDELGDCLKKYNDNRDIQHIIKNSIRNNQFEKIIYVES